MFSFINENQKNLKNSYNIKSSGQEKATPLFCFSDQKINPSIMNDDDKNKIISNSFLKYGYCNSYSVNDNNKLFASLLNSKNNKNKEFSLLYFINTFNKSYSNESTEKKNIIIDLPKISKNLFANNSHIRHKSSNNLDSLTFQKNVHLAKCGGDVVNNFISSIYQKQYSCRNIPNYTISPKKGRKNKGSFINSGKKINNYVISPFSNGNNKCESLFRNNGPSLHLNNGFNLDNKEQKESSEPFLMDKYFNSSLLMKTIISDEYNKN